MDVPFPVVPPHLCPVSSLSGNSVRKADFDVTVYASVGSEAD